MSHLVSEVRYPACGGHSRENKFFQKLPPAVFEKICFPVNVRRRRGSSALERMIEKAGMLHGYRETGWLKHHSHVPDFWAYCTPVVE